MFPSSRGWPSLRPLGQQGHERAVGGRGGLPLSVNDRRSDGDQEDAAAEVISPKIKSRNRGLCWSLRLRSSLFYQP